MAILVIAEHDHHSVHIATRHAVAAAAKIGGEVHLLVVGHQCDGAARAATQIAGVAKVRVADGAVFADQLVENVAAQVFELAKQGYSHILAAATSFGKNLLPRVAALLDVGQVSDITAVCSADTFERPIYAGNVIATVRSLDTIKVITVRGTAFEAVAPQGGAALVEQIAVVAESGLSRLLSREMIQQTRPELSSAPVVVAGGRALGSAENFKLLETLADKLGAALGASRAAVDAGFAPNDWQVGQTGKIVAPQLYLAIGISGAIQHLAGMKDSKVIVAINKDPDAAIFAVADYGLVGDLFEFVPELIAQLP